MKSHTKAFTIVELMVVIATVAILAFTLLPALAATRGSVQKLNCLNNLKQVGMAFRTWEGNHNGKYPMAVGAVSGGANEFLAHSSTTGTATPATPTSLVYCPGMAYMVASNELANTKILFCPSDNIHTANNGYATNFTYGDLLDIATPAFGTYPASKPATQNGESGGSNSKISYFINADATEANSQDIMTGDDNIGNYNAVTSSSTAGFRFGASITSESVTAASAATCVGITSQAWSGSPWWSWTANDFHQKSGNVGMADGSCQSLTISGLHYYLNNSTNSAAAEAINFMP